MSAAVERTWTSADGSARRSTTYRGSLGGRNGRPRFVAYDCASIGVEGWSIAAPGGAQSEPTWPRGVSQQGCPESGQPAIPVGTACNCPETEGGVDREVPGVSPWRGLRRSSDAEHVVLGHLGGPCARGPRRDLLPHAAEQGPRVARTDALFSSPRAQFEAHPVVRDERLGHSDEEV